MVVCISKSVMYDFIVLRAQAACLLRWRASRQRRCCACFPGSGRPGMLMRSRHTCLSRCSPLPNFLPREPAETLLRFK